MNSSSRFAKPILDSLIPSSGEGRMEEASADNDQLANSSWVYKQ